MDSLLSSLANSMGSTPSAASATGGKISANQLLLNQQATQTQINQLLEQSSEALQCGPSCQKEKTKQELQQKYTDAKTNALTAPAELEQSKNNYFAFVHGDAYVERMNEQSLAQQAKSIAAQLRQAFQSEVQNAEAMNTFLLAANDNAQNTLSLLHRTAADNQALKKNLRAHHGDIFTNDRQTDYEHDVLDSLNVWYWWFRWAYWIAFFTFVGACLFVPTPLNRLTRGLLVVFFGMLPWLVSKLFQWGTSTLPPSTHTWLANLWDAVL